MKRFFALLICMLLLFTGCNAADSGDGATGDPTEPSGSVSDSDSNSDSDNGGEAVASLYKIICPKGSAPAIQLLAKSIRDSIKKDHGVTLALSNDAGTADTVSQYEILVGDTNRAESELGYAQAGSAGWWVSAEGSRIVINGGTLAGITAGVEYFLQNYRYSDGKVIFDKAKNKTVFDENALLGKDITLRVASYNIKKAMGRDGTDGEVTKDEVLANVALIGEDIKAKNIDIVGLQEIDNGCGRTFGLDIAKLVAEAAGFEYYYFSKAIDYQGGSYGSAIISKYPIVESQTVTLPRDVAADSEERVVGICTVNVNGSSVKFLNAHLTHTGNGETARAEQLKKIAEVIGDEKGFILTGDFNTADMTLHSSIPNSHKVNHGNYKSFMGASAIDNIILESNWRIMGSGMNDAVNTAHSDHNMLWAEIKYTGGK